MLFTFAEAVRIVSAEQAHAMVVRGQSPETYYIWRHINIVASFSTINITLSTITEEMARSLKAHLPLETRIISLEWEDLMEPEVPFAFLQYEKYCVGNRVMSILAKMLESKKTIFEQMKQGTSKDN